MHGRSLDPTGYCILLQLCWHIYLVAFLWNCRRKTAVQDLEMNVATSGESDASSDVSIERNSLLYTDGVPFPTLILNKLIHSYFTACRLYWIWLWTYMGCLKNYSNFHRAMSTITTKKVTQQIIPKCCLQMDLSSWPSNSIKSATSHTWNFGRMDLRCEQLKSHFAQMAKISPFLHRSLPYRYFFL